jgi:recombination protein RecT
LNQVTTTKQNAVSPKAQIKADMDKMGDQLKAALPSHISVEKFQRVAMTAITSDPDLLYADRRSLFGAITRAAQDGLLPDKREGALVIFNQKIKGKNGAKDEYIKAVQWMPMIAGVLKMVRQSGEISSITANVVHEADDFVLRLGDDESIEHKPPPFGSERGKPIGVYAIATLKDGFKIREVMDMNEIEKVRAVSKTGKFGPWADWWEEMAKKTVIRRLSKRLPMSTDVEGIINDEATDGDFSAGAAAALAGPKPLSREMLEQQASGEPAEQIEDQSDSEDKPTWFAKYEELTTGATNAGTLDELKAIDDEFVKHAAVFPEDQHDEIDQALREARTRITTASEKAE